MLIFCTVTIDCLQKHAHNQFNCSDHDLAFWAQELSRAFKICPDVQNLTQVDEFGLFDSSSNSNNNDDDLGMPLAKDFRKRNDPKF